MSFFKKYEIYCPGDLCWIEVTHDLSSKTVTISDTQTGKSVRICHEQAHHIQQVIDILTHVGRAFGLGIPRAKGKS